MENFAPKFTLIDQDAGVGFDFTESDAGIELLQKLALLVFAGVNLLILATPVLVGVIGVLFNLIHLNIGAAFVSGYLLFLISGIFPLAAMVFMSCQFALERDWGIYLPFRGDLAIGVGTGVVVGIFLAVLGLFSMLLLETRSFLYVVLFAGGYFLVRFCHKSSQCWGSRFWLRVLRDALGGAKDYLLAATFGGAFILWSQALVVVLSFYSSFAPLLWARSVGAIHLPKPSAEQAAAGFAVLILITAVFPNTPWVRDAAGWYGKYKFVGTFLTFIASFSLVLGTAESRNNLFLIESYHLKPITEGKKCRAAVVASIGILNAYVPRMTVTDFKELESILSRARDDDYKSADLEAAAGQLSTDIVDDPHTGPPDDPNVAADPEELMHTDPLLQQGKDALVELIQEKASEHLGHALSSEPLSFFVEALLGNLAERVAGFLPDSVRSLSNDPLLAKQSIERHTKITTPAGLDSGGEQFQPAFRQYGHAAGGQTEICACGRCSGTG
jgi:hypothetical protein